MVRTVRRSTAFAVCEAGAGNKEDGLPALPTYRWTPMQNLRTPISADGAYRIEPLESGPYG
jgi:hypothetical protein